MDKQKVIQKLCENFFIGDLAEIIVDNMSPDEIKEIFENLGLDDVLKSKSTTKSFNDMVKSQRTKNKGIKKDISEIESIAQDIEEMKQKAMEIEEKMYAVDWNQYDMQSFPTKIHNVLNALNSISEGLYIQFLI